MGTVFSDREYYERVIEAFRRRPKCHLILSLGAKLDAASFDQAPENVHIFDYVPQLEVLRRADLMLTHGGIGAINECILFVVPMIAYSSEKTRSEWQFGACSVSRSRADA
jgi:zeaxanthin glucosyltransferase